MVNAECFLGATLRVMIHHYTQQKYNVIVRSLERNFASSFIFFRLNLLYLEKITLFLLY